MIWILTILFLAYAKKATRRRPGVVSKSDYTLMFKFDGKKLSPHEMAKECGEFALKAGIRSVDILNAVGMCVVNTESPEERAKLKYALAIDTRIEDVGEDEVVSIYNTPNDAKWVFQQHLVDVDAPLAWDIYTGENAATETIVAVIDTGIAYGHPDLNGHMWRNTHEEANDGIDNDNNGIIDDVYGVDFSVAGGELYGGDPNDVSGHGTHCAGIIAAQGNNGIGVTGVAWGGVKLMAMKFITDSGEGLVSAAVKSLNYAFEHGAQISSNSWGGPGASSSMRNAIEAVRASGHLFVTAAGNSGLNNDVTSGGGHYPCAYEQSNLMCVGSVSSEGKLSDFSNYGGTTVDITAPGEYVYSTDIQQTDGTFGYMHQSGTSMATPVVAGLAALLKSYRPNLMGSELRSIIMGSVDFKTHLEGRIVSSGIVNAHRAMTLASETSGTVSPIPTGWSTTTSVQFEDEDDTMGKIDGTVVVDFSPEVVPSIRQLAFYFTRNDTVIGEISRVDLTSETVASTAVEPRRLEISMHGITADQVQRVRHTVDMYSRIMEASDSVRILQAATGTTRFEFRITSLILSSATHLALKVSNGIGFSVDMVRIPLTDKGFSNAHATAMELVDTDPRPGSIAGQLVFSGPKSEVGISSYVVTVGTEQLADVPAFGMDIPLCDEASTHCNSIDSHWRDTDTFVLSRGQYEPWEFASYTFHGPGTFEFEKLHVENDYDYVKIGERKYTGYAAHMCPYTVPAGPITVVWYSDYSGQEEGFTLLFKPLNHYSVDIPPMPMPVATAPLTIRSAVYGTVDLTREGSVVGVTDTVIQLQMAFQDRIYEHRRIGGNLVITINYRGNEDGINVYFSTDDQEYILHSSHTLMYDAQTLVVQVPDASPYTIGSKIAQVVFTVNGQEVAGSMHNLALQDATGHVLTEVQFGQDDDAREGHIHGHITVSGLPVNETNFLEYRAYGSRGTDKLQFLGSVRPAPLEANCFGQSCEHLKIERHDDFLILDYLDMDRMSYEAYENVTIRITGPGMLFPTYRDMEHGYDFLRVFQGPAYNNIMVAEWTGSGGEISDTTQGIALGNGTYDIVWKSDYFNPVNYQGWRLKWAPTPNNTIEVAMNSVDATGFLVVSTYGNSEWTTEMEIGAYIAVEDWALKSVECTETHMACPLPAQWATHPYHVRGAETDSYCQVQSYPVGGVQWVGFSFNKTQCNVQRLWDFTRGVIIDQVVLVPTTTAAGEAGGVIFSDEDAIAPEILCQCESPISGNGTFGTTPERSNKTSRQETILLKNGNEFHPSMALYKDASFSIKFGSGETYPHVTDQFYWEVASIFALDNIAVQSCMASPSTDFTNPYAVYIIKDFCEQAPFDVLFIEPAENVTSRKRFSVRKFTFAHQSELFVSCSVRRCDPSDHQCGVCNPSRRLIPAEETDSSEVSTWVYMPHDDDYLVLENAPATDVFVIGENDVNERLENVPRVVQTQVRFDSAPPWLRQCNGAECAMVAQALECSLAETLSVPCDNVVVTSIRERGARVRRLRSRRSSESDAVNRRLSGSGGGVEVMFSIVEPEDAELASSLTADISSMASGGDNLQVFADSLKREITQRIPEADTSSISSTSFAVAEPRTTITPTPTPTPSTTPPPPTPNDPTPSPTSTPDPEGTDANPDYPTFPPVTEPVVFHEPAKPVPTTTPADSKIPFTIAFLVVSGIAALAIIVICIYIIRRKFCSPALEKDNGPKDEYSWNDVNIGPHIRLEDFDDPPLAAHIANFANFTGKEFDSGQDSVSQNAANFEDANWEHIDIQPQLGVPRLSVREDVSVEDVDDDCFTLDTISSRAPFSPQHSGILSPAQLLQDRPTTAPVSPEGRMKARAGQSMLSNNMTMIQGWDWDDVTSPKTTR